MVLAILAWIGGGVMWALRSQVGAVRPLVGATEWADKMVSRATAAGDDWLKGVQNPRRSPTAGMKASNTKYKNAMQKALQEDRWNKAISTLTDDAIQTAAVNAGSGAFTAGISSRKDKIAAAIARLQPKVAAIVNKIQAMPQDTDQQRESRMLENLRAMRGLKGS